MRDARFGQALAHAPDAGDLPGEAVRRAVRAAARSAVESRRSGGLSSWLAAGSGQRLPWNAVFATVLLAGLVTTLWWEREIPDARPRPARLEQPVPLPAPVAVPPAAPAPPVPRAADEARDRAASARAEQARKERSVDEEQARGAMRKAQQEHAARSAAASSAQAAVAAAAPAPATAAALRAPFNAAWTHLRIDADGRSLEVRRGQAPALAQLLDDLIALRGEPAQLREPVTARIEVLRDGEALGVLELAPPRIRWTARNGSARVVPASEAQLRALLEEVQRLAGR